MLKKMVSIILTIISLILLFVLAIKLVFPLKYFDEINKYSDIDKSLVFAIIKAESDFDEKAISPKGAIGVMQVMPKTGEWIAKKNNIKFNDSDLLSYKKNIKLGILYLKYLSEKFNNKQTDIITGYNAGPSRVNSGEWKNFNETKVYLARVKFYKKIYEILLWFDNK